MKLLGLASLGLAQEWSKCSQLCDGGEQTQTNCASNCVRSCNIESCSVYDDSLFTNTHVDDLTGWNCNANCQMELIDDGYSGTGIQVAARNQKWQGLSQIIDASQFMATRYVGKVFVQVAENISEDFPLEMMAAKLLTADGTTQYEEVGRVTIPAGSTAWYPLNFAIENSNFGQFSQIKFYIQSEQTSVSYRADEFYLVDQTTILPEPVGLIRDGDFEFHQFGSDWYGNAATVEYIDATDAPKGNSYAKISGRTAAWGGLYIDMPLDQSYVGGDTTTRFLQLSFSFKMDEGDMENWVPGDMSSPKAQIKIKNTEGQTNYINCLFACGIPDGQWQQWESNCDPIEDNVGSVETATLFISGLEHKDGTFMDYYVDDVKLDWWTRDQSWIQAANLRIDDIRKIDLKINTAGRADVASIDIKMKKADYTWGATMDKFMMNGEVSDLGQFRK